MKRILWWLLAGTRGGGTRARIILFLRERPANANQIANALSLDYKTVRYHLNILVNNRVLEDVGQGYGKSYFLSSEMEESFDTFSEIWDKIGKKQLKREED
ncbi:MAG: winged helix-turn-helix domain-containing protein [Candidatus Hydrothermarchaeales archaeon]